MVNKIACFLTCGYTEAGAMQAFLKKINPQYEYKQFLPNKTIKKKGTPKLIGDEINGLTGDALLNKVYEILKKYRDEINDYKAILIEDDLDGRFFGCDESCIERHRTTIIDTIHKEIGVDLPVFILYASPEIESWFLADWTNGFEYLYCDSGIVGDISNNVKQYFAHHLKHYIKDKILKEYADNIEDYGYFNGKYVKLSNEIISAIDRDAKEYISQLSGTNQSYNDQILSSKDLYYSKKLHGDRMLRNILPDCVAIKCRKYFWGEYNNIRNFQL